MLQRQTASPQENDTHQVLQDNTVGLVTTASCCWEQHFGGFFTLLGTLPRCWALIWLFCCSLRLDHICKWQGGTSAASCNPHTSCQHLKHPLSLSFAHTMELYRNLLYSSQEMVLTWLPHSTSTCATWSCRLTWGWCLWCISHSQLWCIIPWGIA